MHYPTVLLAALFSLTAAAAAPVEQNSTLDERGAAPYPLVMFSDDNHCGNQYAQIELHPDKFATGKPFGIIGSHSAYFVNVNGLASWSLQEGGSRATKKKTVKPAVNQCVVYNDVFAVGDVSLVVHG